MDKTIDYNYTQGLSSLEDLKTLVSPELCSFVDQAIFHLHGLKYQIAKDKNQDLNNFNSLLNLLKFRVEEGLKKALKDNGNLKSLVINYGHDSLTLKTWDKIIDMLGPFLELIRIFNFKNQVTISISNEKVGMHANLEVEGWDEDFKVKVYKITRLFLNHKSLLTYKILNQDKGNKISTLCFQLDLSHDDSFYYCIDLKSSLNLVLGLTNIFKNYHVSDDSIHLYKNHPCLEITEKLSLERHKNIPAELRDFKLKVLNIKSILHFPFLFRPISLIIPKRGQIIPVEKINCFLNSGNENGIEDKFKEESIQKNSCFYSLDFFSFLNL